MSLLNKDELLHNKDHEWHSPLWLRVDVGAAVDASKFLTGILIDFAKLIQERWHKNRGLRHRIRTFARTIGQWTRHNRTWITATLLIVLIAQWPISDTALDPMKTPADLLEHGTTMSLGSTLDTTRAWLVSEHAMLLLPSERKQEAMIITMLLIWLFIMSTLFHKGGAEGQRSGGWPLSIVLGGIQLWLLATLATTGPSLLTALAGLQLLVFGYLIFVNYRSARLWELLAEADRVLSKAQSSSAESPNTSLPYVGNLVAQFLPQRYVERLTDLTVPQLEQEVKVFFRSLRQAGYQFLLLVDDLDLLDSEHQGAFVKTIRPLSKSKAGSVVLITPRHFYPAYMQVQPNDLHSTVSDVFYLAPKGLFELEASGVVQVAADLKRSNVETIVAQATWNPGWGNLGADELYAWRETKLFQQISRLWDVAPDSPHQAQTISRGNYLRAIIENTGGSYREITRLTRELLRPTAKDLAEHWQEREQAESTMELLKTDLAKRSNVLK